MGRKSKAEFKMKGHALPGINQKSETVNKKDGRSPSSAFQQKSIGAIAGRVAGLAAKKNLLNPGGGDSEDAEAGKKLLKEEAKAEMEEESTFAMKSPTKKKLKSGTKTTVGGKLNEGTSPYQDL